MKLTARLYNCARCHCQVRICSRCDRGNIYCNAGCSSAAREQKQKEANRRHSISPKGRLANAQRQRRYRQRLRERNNSTPQHRQEEKVTDQGSPVQLAGALLPSASSLPEKITSTVSIMTGATACCHFCAMACSAYVRLEFFRNRRRRFFNELTRNEGVKIQ